VQYAKSVVRPARDGGHSTNMPPQSDAGGVIPVIFASSIGFSATLRGCRSCEQDPKKSKKKKKFLVERELPILSMAAALRGLSWWNRVLLLFLRSIIFNPMKPPDNMRKYGGFIPGSGRGRQPAST